VALLFALVFLLESFGIAMPLLSLETQHPNFVPSIYSQTVSLFAAVGIATFAVYEIFFFPSFLKNNHDVEIHKKSKNPFCKLSYSMVYHDYLCRTVRWHSMERLAICFCNVWIYILGGD
jgi:hypothetical protein